MTEPELPEGVVKVDWQQLSTEALRGVLVDLVTRGEPDEVSIERRCDQLLAAIKAGKQTLYFDSNEEQIFLQ